MSKLKNRKINKVVKNIAGLFAGNFIPAIKKANEKKARTMYANKNRSTGGQGSK